MQVKINYTNIDTFDLLGDTDKFVGVQASYYDKYENNKKVEEKVGTKVTVMVHIPSKEVKYEKLDVKILGASPSAFKPDEYVRFKNLRLSVSKIEFGVATLVGTADSYEMVSDNTQDDNEQIKGQIKLNLDSKK